MISYFNYISLIAVFSLPVMAQEIKLNEWTKEYVKEMVGAREDIQYSIYKKVGESDKIYLEFQNRKNKDVKVSFKIVNKALIGVHQFRWLDLLRLMVFGLMDMIVQ